MHRSPPAPSPFDDGAAAKLRSRSVLRDAVELYVQAPTHDRSEVRAFGDLVDGLLAGAGFIERRFVSETLAKRPDVAPDLALRLAVDTAEVAAPMIVASPVLTSADLVQILRRGPEHVRLVAERLDLGDDLASVLIDSNFAQPAERRSAMARPAAQAAAIPARRATDPAPASAETLSAASPLPTAANVAVNVATGLPAELISPSPTESTEMAEISRTPAAGDSSSLWSAPEIPHFRVPLRSEAPAVRDPEARGEASFLDLDAGGRWRAIQLAAAEAAVAPPVRSKPGQDLAALTHRLFTAAVAHDTAALTSELAEALDLDVTTAARVAGDASGEPLAVALAALGVEDRRATSILLLAVGETAGLDHMQDLAAMAGQIGWRTAEILVSQWRGDRTARLSEGRRAVDATERREAASAKAADRSIDGLRRATEDLARRLGERR